MTKAQIKRLETILAKAETLQAQCAGADAENLQVAKSALMRALNRATR